jgi:septum site-determining protein MinD
VALASQGKKVCCIDADIGLRNLDIVLGLENRIVYDLVDVVEGRAKLRQAMIKDKRLEELYLIPAAQTRDKTAVSPSDMVRICDELRTIVDYVIIDSPAGIERGFRNALAPADMVVIVTNPEVSSVRDADRIIGLIEAEAKGPGNLIINRVKSEMVKRGDMLSPEDVIDILAIKLIGLVPEDESIIVSSNRGMPAALKPEDSRAGVAFQNIARRIMGQEVPFMDMEENKSWTQRLLKAFGIGVGSDSSKSDETSMLKPDRPTAAAAPPVPAPAPQPAPSVAAPTLAPAVIAPVVPAASSAAMPAAAVEPPPAARPAPILPPPVGAPPAGAPPAPTTAVPASTARSAAPPPSAPTHSMAPPPPAPSEPPPPAVPAPSTAQPAADGKAQSEAAKPADEKDSAEKPASKTSKVANSANSQPGS